MVQGPVLPTRLAGKMKKTSPSTFTYLHQGNNLTLQQARSSLIVTIECVAVRYRQEYVGIKGVNRGRFFTRPPCYGGSCAELYN